MFPNYLSEVASRLFLVIMRTQDHSQSDDTEPPLSMGLLLRTWEIPILTKREVAVVFAVLLIWMAWRLKQASILFISPTIQNNGFYC
jgi:hypothetical protein